MEAADLPVGRQAAPADHRTERRYQLQEPYHPGACPGQHHRARNLLAGRPNHRRRRRRAGARCAMARNEPLGYPAARPRPLGSKQFHAHPAGTALLPERTRGPACGRVQLRAEGGNPGLEQGWLSPRRAPHGIRHGKASWTSGWDCHGRFAIPGGLGLSTLHQLVFATRLNPARIGSTITYIMQDYANPISRRSLLKTATAASAFTFLQPHLVRGAGKEKLRAGIVGCGGRGTQAIVDTLTGNENVELVAMADVLPDHLDSSLAQL